MKKEVVGQKFGKLTVTSEADKRSSNGEKHYNCLCECGDETVVSGSNLRRNHTTSCGCIRSNAVKAAYEKAAAKKKTSAKSTAKKPIIVDAPGAYHIAIAVPIDTIAVQKNIRTVVDITSESDPKLPDLAENIKQVGILEPLILNKCADNEYHLVAGHRRLAAAKIAELKHVPAVIYEGLTPQQALEIQISENLHRVDLRPTEEADVYARMRDELGLSIEDIALRIGRSQAHVYQYIKMLTLPDNVLLKINNGDIGISKAITLSTLPAHIVDAIVNGSFYYLLSAKISSREFPIEIKRYFMAELSDTLSFDMTQEYTIDDVVYPACTACPHKKQVSLFSNVVNDNTCLDRNCFYSKDTFAMTRKANAQSVDDDDDDDVDVAEESNHHLERRRQEWEQERERRQQADAEQNQRRAEWYLDHKFKKGFSPSHFFPICDFFFENSFGVGKDIVDDLYKKYVGKNIKQLAETGTCEEIVQAMVIHRVFNAAEEYEDTFAEWAGCDVFPEATEASDDY